MIKRLTAAGPIAALYRVGHPPFDIDQPIDIVFESGATFHIDVGPEGASDIAVREGEVIETYFGHLRSEDPEEFAAIKRTWSRAPIDLPWLIGARLAHPRRLTMTHPYRLAVGYVFDAAGAQFALFGSADLIFAATLDDPSIASFALEVGAPAVGA